ncbi:hypothetical protein KS4_11650 [Poriferisphaera corsica]|uniref:PEP-CTERM protein-sorting domain-containing protein n=1 Tax=Poriferisphaera corsica TaxID=2528020 RepID=A0A517YSB6_9BACT|nr:PEP-CTERM sorting domain-containing protein [Poriferisphaera corsica]QDU33123.1 hypothetical protein KS4_11650 [Poriferisphaera corsica]
MRSLFYSATIALGLTATASAATTEINVPLPTYTGTLSVTHTTDGPASNTWNASIPAGNNNIKQYLAWTPDGGPLASKTINDIARITYNTKDANVSDALDWYIQIYTAKQDDGGDFSWYRNRFTAEVGYISQANGSAVDNTWTHWDTSSTDANTKLIFQSTNNTFNAAGNDLAALKSSYGSESILALSINAGDTGAGWAYDGSISGLTVELTDGSAIQYNFVPEPASLSFLALGSLALLRRKHA